MIPKFRIWDKKNSEFILFPHSIVLNIDGTVEGIEYEMPREGIVYNDIKYLELLQSTGLFDKNCKEVFESEIVDVRTLEGTIYLRGIVKKVKGGLYIEGLHFSKNIPLTDFYFKSYTNTLEIEILGNIYQDKHLLEEE